MDLEHLYRTRTIMIEPWGEVKLHLIDSETTGRTSYQHGIAWWVNRRLVGDFSWDRMWHRDKILDRRIASAKRYTFIAEVDILVEDVEDDWSKFKATQGSHAVVNQVEEHVIEWLGELMGGLHKERKIMALEDSRDELVNLPKIGQEQIAHFLDEIQKKAPTINQETLNDAVSVLCTLEKTRSGRSLLAKLAKLSPAEMEKLHDILSDWNIHDIKVVLDELEWRLKLISELERLVENPSTNELHQLQPLFEGGLWIFGPEYESIEFASNRTLATVINKFLPGKKTSNYVADNPRKRPDFVALPDRSIGVYACDGYDTETGEVNGVSKVLIVELKRGGFKITQGEVDQAKQYAIELKRSGRLRDDTIIIGFVLGARLDDGAGKTTWSRGSRDEVFIYPKTYGTILSAAHARTFNLLKKIRDTRSDLSYDPDLESVLNKPGQLAML